PMPGELAMFIGPYLDLPRTDSLVWNVFMHRGGIPDGWNHWVDVATQSIPLYYAYTHIATAQAHAMRGDSTQVDRHMERANAWHTLGRREARGAMRRTHLAGARARGA